MIDYSVRYAFVCSDVPYRRHMVCTIRANNLSEAAIKAQDDLKNLSVGHEVISIHNRSDIIDVTPRSFW
jgi:CheY-specific phosphatase CheX